MNGPLLRSGTLTEFEPLGAGGETLFRSASEFRAAVSRRLGSESADCFAIPQSNNQGDTLDWYAPMSAKEVLEWRDLPDQEHDKLKAWFQELNERLAQLRETLTKEGKAEYQSFSQQLEHGGTIPDSSHIYLVGGHPVLTFWGFRRRDDAPVVNNAAPPTLPSCPEEGIGSRGLIEPSIESQAVPADDPDSQAAATLNRIETGAQGNSAHGVRWQWLAALLLILLGLLLWWFLGQDEPAVPTTGTSETTAAPLRARETESQRSLSGYWQATAGDLVDTTTQLPLALSYELDGEKGRIHITKPDGSVCSAEADATFDGNSLTLEPRTAIVCPNGDPYFGTTLTCRPSTDRQTLCTGSFPNGTVFRVVMHKQQVP